MLVQALTQAGHAPKVFSFLRQYPAFLYPGKSDKDPGSRPTQTDYQYVADPLYPWTWWNCAHSIEQFSPGLAIFAWWTTFWAPAYSVIARLINKSIPVTFLIHNTMPHEARRVDIWLARLALSSACHFVTLSPQETKRLEKLLPGSRITRCSHPVFTLSERKPARREARTRLGLDLEDSVLLFFGIVRPYKGLRVLLDALGLLRVRGKSPHLLVVGEFWEDIRLYHQQIEQLGLSNQVLIVDRYVPDDELVDYFAAADLFVAPYVGGTQSGAIKTAIGFGLPVLATDQIASDLPNEVVIVPAGDRQALASALEICLKNPPLAVAMSGSLLDPWEPLLDYLKQI